LVSSPNAAHTCAGIWVLADGTNVTCRMGTP
jgi:hypothetical protein